MFPRVDTGEPALAPDRGRISVSPDTLPLQRPRQVKGVVRRQEKAEVHEPFNMRPDDYRYCLLTDDAYGWQTGRTPRPA